MTAKTTDYPVTFFYATPVVLHPGREPVSSTEVQVPVARESRQWTPADAEKFVRKLADTMKELGDPGPFRWSLTRVPGGGHQWTFKVEGQQMSARPAVPLRDDQVPQHRDGLF